jgi:hypothetical protein
VKLTKSDRDAFVRAVMGDVPKVEYDDLARALMLKHFRKLADLRLLAMYDDKVMRSRLTNLYIPTPTGLTGVYHPLAPRDHYKFPPAIDAELAAMGQQSIAQSKALDELRDRVKSMIAGCTTLKAAQEKMPEFAKYLPASRDGLVDHSMPVVANVVDALVAAGWPKK